MKYEAHEAAEDVKVNVYLDEGDLRALQLPGGGSLEASARDLTMGEREVVEVKVFLSSE